MPVFKLSLTYDRFTASAQVVDVLSHMLRSAVFLKGVFALVQVRHGTVPPQKEITPRDNFLKPSEEMRDKGTVSKDPPDEIKCKF